MAKTYAETIGKNWQFVYGENGQVKDIDYSRELPSDGRDISEIRQKDLDECERQKEALREDLIKIA